MSKNIMKCETCSRQKPTRTRLQTIKQPYSGKTILGRAVESEIRLQFWLCKCGVPNVEAVTLPLDPDEALLWADEKEFGAATPAVVQALGKMKQQACLQLGNEMDDNEELFLETVRRVRAEIGDDWPNRVDFAATHFVVEEQPTE